MKLLLDSNVFEDVKRDKVLSDNLDDLRNILKEASIELDNPTIIDGCPKKFCRFI